MTNFKTHDIIETLPRGSLENEQLNIILLCVFVCETQICITELLAVTAIHSAARVFIRVCLMCCSVTASFVSPHKDIRNNIQEVIIMICYYENLSK